MARSSGRGMGKVVALLAASLGLAIVGGCSGSQMSMDTASAAQAAVDQRIAGVWRLTSYVPAAALSPAMLLSMQSDKIVVRFERGVLRSETTSLTFERAYRIADVSGSNFTIFIKDDQGIEYESVCQFDEGGRIHFQTVTNPWTGRGVLEREGTALGVAY